MSDVLETPGQLQYQLYLESEHWARLRADAIALAGGRCSKCGRTNRLQVHHIRYRNPWESCTVEDVKVLCRPCHAEVHGVPVDEDLSRSGKQPARIYVHMDDLDKARSSGLISREEYVAQKARIRSEFESMVKANRAKMTNKKRFRMSKRQRNRNRWAFMQKKQRLGWSF